MKVLISGVMIATLVTTCANAAITVEQRKAACEKSTDKVWVEATETCVPKNPCLDETFKTYCSTKFEKNSVASSQVAEKLARLELNEASCNVLDVVYLACKYRYYFGAGYFVYKFASMDEKDPETAKHGEYSAVCKIYDGFYNSSKVNCYLAGSPTEAKKRCEEIAQKTEINTSFDSEMEICLFK